MQQFNGSIAPRRKFTKYFQAASLCAAMTLSACSGGNTPAGQGAADSNCSGSCGTDQATRLSAADVEQVVAQAVAEAKARNVRATVAVTDRVGNVLAVFRMRAAQCQLNAATCSVTVRSGRVKADGTAIEGGLEEISVIPDTLAAISKAITGAYLASEGMAFTTRTAGQIVQEHFNPGELNQPAGPLFGVQFSQLPCSDFNTRFDGSAGATVGPHRAPLGLSADTGGLPLYKNGVPVGGVGVIADGLYSLDLNILDLDSDIDELLATAATQNFAAPANRRADRITVDGKVLRFADIDLDDVLVRDAPALSSLPASDGQLVAVPGYTDGTVIPGTAFGFAESGIRPDAGESFEATVDGVLLDAFVLVDDNNVPRFAPKDGTDGLLTAAEVKALLEQSLTIANRARGQIRVPLGSQARVSISVVDTNGEILGVIRSRDAPIFGLDVGLQKARTAAFFSSADAASDLLATPPAQYLGNNAVSRIADYVTDVREFLGDASALTGSVAFADRSGGNLSRPYFPDGIIGNPNGPLSKPIDEWSPFSTGLQLDLVNNAILKHVIFVLGGGSDTEAGECTELPPTGVNGSNNRLQNGIQIFPGSVPIYRGSQLVGGIGVSGDGIDQDDMISFLGLHNAGLQLGSINQAPMAIRADNLRPMGERLRFVNCPQAPFLNSNEQDPCSGK